MEESLERYLDTFKRIYFDGQYLTEVGKRTLERKAKILNLNQTVCEEHIKKLEERYKEFSSLLEDIYSDGHITENQAKEMEEFGKDLCLDKFEIEQLKKLVSSKNNADIKTNNSTNNNIASTATVVESDDEEIYVDDPNVISAWERFKKVYLEKYISDGRLVKLRKLIDKMFDSNYKSVSDHSIIVLAKEKIGFDINKLRNGEWYDEWLKCVYEYYNEKYPKLVLDEWIFVVNRIEFMAFINEDEEINPYKTAASIMRTFFEEGKNMELQYMRKWKKSEVFSEVYANTVELLDYAKEDLLKVKKMLGIDSCREETNETLYSIKENNESSQEINDNQCKAIEKDMLYLRTNGYYMFKEEDYYKVFRFYDDGVVIYSSVNSSEKMKVCAKSLLKWLYRGYRDVSIDKYSIDKENNIKIEIPISGGYKVNYRGKIKVDCLVLDWHSTYNGNRGSGRFHFVDIDDLS